MTRYYNVWAGNRKGTPENVLHCVVEVSDADGGGWFSHQCTRRRGHGPDGEYCKQHAAMLAAGQKLFVPEHRGERKEK